jgi:hypothetical protein
MKPLYLILIISVLGISCKSNSKEDQIAVFEGNWILKEIIKNTEAQLSVKKALALSDFYATELVFDATGDSVSVYNGQEGYVRLPIKKIDNNFSFQIRGSKASPILFDSSDSCVYFADSTLNRVYRFFKADQSFLNKNFDEPVAFPSYINNSLIVGDWKRGPEEIVNFQRFGTIQNWNDFTTYEIIINGEYGNNIDADLIILRTSEKAQLFGFKRQKQSIQFFDLIPIGDSNTYKNGKLLHELTL